MKSDRPVIRKTLTQERFEILIEKQRTGTASFKDLTDLDEIVNRDPDIRISILEEMEGKTPPNEDTTGMELPLQQQVAKTNFPTRIKQLIDRLFRFTPRIAVLS